MRAGLETEWETLLGVRTEVLAKLEVLRAEKTIGKSLEAVVSLHVTGYGDAALQKYAEALCLSSSMSPRSISCL